MKDINGIEIEVGQNVVMAMPHGRNAGASLLRGTIVRMCPKTVKVVSDRVTGPLTKAPDKICVLQEMHAEVAKAYTRGYNHGVAH
jgi:hypothetical protein